MPAEGDKLPAGEVTAWRTRVQYAVDASGTGPPGDRLGTPAGVVARE